MRHAFLVALSFANICYLRVWAEILTYRPWDTYLMTTPPDPWNTWRWWSISC